MLTLTSPRIVHASLAALALAAVSLSGLAGCASNKNAEPAKAKANGSYAFWPAPPDEPRIQFLVGLDSSEDVSPTKSSQFEKIVFGADAVRPAFVNKPYGVAIRSGKIYVCDIRAKAIVVLDLAKKQTRLVGITGANRVERPIAIAVADDGMLYVADAVQQAIMVFDANERFTAAFSIPKLKPGAVAVGGNRLYVSDLGRQQVLMIDRRTGKEVGAIGSVGDGDGQFRLPIGVSVDKSGNVYVADMMRCRVQKFSPEGSYISGFGELGDHAGGFARPKHLAVDSEGIAYVVDSAFQNVQMFNDQNQLLMHFGSAGNYVGAMGLPVGIAVTDDSIEYFKERIHPGFEATRLIVVANQFGNGKVGIYALGHRRSNYALSDLRANGVNVATGVAEPSAEQLKFQNIGGTEPTPEGDAQPQNLEEPEKPTTPPAAKPTEPPAGPKS